MGETFVSGTARQDAPRQELNRQTNRHTNRAQELQRQDGGRDGQTTAPRVDVLEDDTGITLLADMPGVSKDSLEINVENDALSIEGTVSAVTPQAMQATYAEVRIPRYRRSFTLSRELDPGRIEAQLKDGVLKLRIPKHEQARPQRISVKVT